MKEVNDILIPETLLYTEDHEWLTAEGNPVRMGVTDFAQDQLGDVVFVELPEVGTRFEKGEVCATIESVKAVSEIYMPVTGLVVAVNEKLTENPELVNASPYEEGWIFELEMEDVGEKEALKNGAAYREMLKGL
ncbi:glycine cleavage system protein GcvH [Desulfococcaceae bacterium OttesenSCG-928-F15]|nr:glycine cleavage system protein GcvH [Desulfococcaceae bacterium OttesenSCG-928-F15]